MQLPLSGACQCKGVRYKINAEPLTVYACHCGECQRQSGSAFSLSMVVPRESITVVSGSPKEWLRTHESGRIISCIFCGTCGTRLFHNPRANEAISIVKCGTLDSVGRLQPVGHIWTSGAQKWFAIPTEAVSYEGQQPDMSRLIAAWKSIGTQFRT